MIGRPFFHAARRFMVYRHGESVNWDCTYADLSRATGIDHHEVSEICRSPVFRKKGWFPRVDRHDTKNSFAQQIPVDRLMDLGRDSPVRAVYDY